MEEKTVYCDLEGGNISASACKSCKKHLSTCPHEGDD